MMAAYQPQDGGTHPLAEGSFPVSNTLSTAAGAEFRAQKKEGVNSSFFGRRKKRGYFMFTCLLVSEGVLDIPF
jgi:hypothetical protein